jgi:SAM-dependent methyltransferase
MIVESVSVCPICAANSFTPFLTTKDYTVSQTDFRLIQCNSCKFVITSPRPDLSSIADFYKSAKYISHSGGTKTLLDKIYLKARGLSLRWKHELIIRYKSNGSILDYGCGTGEFLQHMQTKQWNISGVEPSEAARNKAQAIVNTKIYSELKSTTDKFDVITLWHVLEHVHDLNEKVDELISHLNEGGIIFIAVPNHESQDAKKYGVHWAGYDVPRHLWHFSPNNMKQLFAKHGLRLLKIHPMKLDSYYVSMLSESYKNTTKAFPINYTKAFVSGFQSNYQAAKTGSYSSLIYIASRS